MAFRLRRGVSAAAAAGVKSEVRAIRTVFFSFSFFFFFFRGGVVCEAPCCDLNAELQVWGSPNLPICYECRIQLDERGWAAQTPAVQNAVRLWFELQLGILLGMIVIPLTSKGLNFLLVLDLRHAWVNFPEKAGVSVHGSQQPTAHYALVFFLVQFGRKLENGPGNVQIASRRSKRPRLLCLGFWACAGALVLCLADASGVLLPQETCLRGEQNRWLADLRANLQGSGCAWACRSEAKTLEVPNA